MYQPTDDELNTATNRVQAILRRAGIRNPDDLVDAAQTTLLDALETCDPRRSPFTAWACQLAFWWLKDHWARKERHEEAMTKLATEDGIERNADERASRPDYASEVHRATLVADAKAALRGEKDEEDLGTYLRLLLRDLGPTEIAAEMGISAKRAASLQTKLLYRLRAHFGCKNPKKASPEDHAIFENLI